MPFLLDPGFWARWLGIVFINLSLSGDNALVDSMSPYCPYSATVHG